MPVHAPAPAAVDGLLAVPIHILGLRARVFLDARTRTGRVRAVMRFRTGAVAGCPVFDLRQTIDEVSLDGRPIATEHVGPHQVGEGPDATIRVLDVPQASGSTHTLRFAYRLARPSSDLSGAYPPVLSARGPGRVRWSLGMGDLFDGRHLEMWFPSNLPFDQFPFLLDLRLAGVDTRHTLVTNGAATRTGVASWDVAFPAWFSSVSAMVELWPTDELDHVRRDVPLAGSGRTVPVDLWKVRGRPEDLRAEGARVARLLQVNESVFGPFPLDRYTCFFHDRTGGMEYAGATTTSSGALAHEVLHSWFARGVMPAADTDGWWDEAFTTFVTSGAAPQPLDFCRPPVQLCSRRPLQRHTDPAAYREGSRVFSGLAALLGPQRLIRSMGALYRARRRTCLSTADLEEHLVRDTGDMGVVDVFHRFVYGFGDAPRVSGVRLDRADVVTGPDGRPWVEARVENERDAGVCDHFVVLFSTVPAVAPRTTAPGAPAADLAAVAGFDLRPGRSRVVRVPAPGAVLRDGGPEVVVGVHVRLADPSVARAGARGVSRAGGPNGPARAGGFAG